MLSLVAALLLLRSGVSFLTISDLAQAGGHTGRPVVVAEVAVVAAVAFVDRAVLADLASIASLESSSWSNDDDSVKNGGN